MIKRFNRNYIQKCKEVDTEFTNCMNLMIMTSAVSDEGYLIAISDSPDSTNEMCCIMDAYSDDTVFRTGGFYEDSMLAGIINLLK